MKKQELTRRIYKYNVPLKTLKYSYLYLLAIEKKDALGNIMERYVKFGKTIDAKKRYKAFEKDYAGYEIGYIWISFDRGFRWLDIETTYIENKLKKKLDYAFEKYSDRNTQKIYGYTEMYIADCHDDNEFKMYIESELAQILRADCKTLEDLVINV